jgi:hypothetical protein
MAGTIVADTLQNGAGTSTSMDNAINGSAKAWVNYKGTATRAINASYNVSSVTFNGTGDYTVNFTNALTDANYSAVASCGSTGNNTTGADLIATTHNASSSSVRLASYIRTGSFSDTEQICVSVFR